MPRRFSLIVAAVFLFGGPGLAQTGLAQTGLAQTGLAQTGPAQMPAAPAPQMPAAPPEGRVFCQQPVNVAVAAPDSVPEPFRGFVGIFSDAAWTPQLCAALVVGGVTADGTATITYVFGPSGTSARGAGGVLHGTGVIRGGELRFQNSDGSQFAFKPFYSDLDGHLVTPKGESYEAIFKRTY